jgi:eIF3 subunit 6 N terminal domain
MVDGTAVPLAGDLTQQLAKHLDRHLVFPLLEFLHHRQLYDEADIQKAKIALLDHTNMVDFAMDIHETLYGKGSVPQAMNDRRDEVGSLQHGSLHDRCFATLFQQHVRATHVSHSICLKVFMVCRSLGGSSRCRQTQRPSWASCPTRPP